MGSPNLQLALAQMNLVILYSTHCRHAGLFIQLYSTRRQLQENIQSRLENTFEAFFKNLNGTWEDKTAHISMERFCTTISLLPSSNIKICCTSQLTKSSAEIATTTVISSLCYSKAAYFSGLKIGSLRICPSTRPSPLLACLFCNLAKATSLICLILSLLSP